jgi:hypothetical protein
MIAPVAPRLIVPFGEIPVLRRLDADNQV